MARAVAWEDGSAYVPILASNDYTLAINAASTLSKKEHDAYMAVIRNIGG